MVQGHQIQSCFSLISLPTTTHSWNYRWCPYIRGNKDISMVAKNTLKTEHHLSMEICLDWEAHKDPFGELCPNGEICALVHQHLHQKS